MMLETYQDGVGRKVRFPARSGESGMHERYWTGQGVLFVAPKPIIPLAEQAHFTLALIETPTGRLFSSSHREFVFACPQLEEDSA